MALQVTVELNIKTCERCAGVYAVPNWVAYARCPMCAGHKIEELEMSRDSYQRSNEALRGVITRIKNAPGK